jgi:hypothetical protein
MNYKEQEDYWNKLSFVIDGDDGDYGIYRDELYGILVELFQRIKKLEEKSHMHKMQLPEYNVKEETK